MNLFILAIKDSLMKTGVLHEIRAQIRAEIYRMLQEETEPPPPLSNENLIINELIREYLLYNGYLFTESVLIAGKKLFSVFALTILSFCLLRAFFLNPNTISFSN